MLYLLCDKNAYTYTIHVKNKITFITFAARLSYDLSLPHTTYIYL